MPTIVDGVCVCSAPFDLRYTEVSHICAPAKQTWLRMSLHNVKERTDPLKLTAAPKHRAQSLRMQKYMVWSLQGRNPWRVKLTAMQRKVDTEVYSDATLIQKHMEKFTRFRNGTWKFFIEKQTCSSCQVADLFISHKNFLY